VKPSVVCLTLATIALIVYQVWFMTVYLHPPEAPERFHVDPLPNYLFPPACVMLASAWSYFLLRRRKRTAGAFLDRSSVMG